MRSQRVCVLTQVLSLGVIALAIVVSPSGAHGQAFAGGLDAAFTESAPDTITVSIASGPVTVIQDGALRRVEMEGTEPSGAPGDPLLPRKTFRVALPPDADLASVTVTLGATAQRQLALDGVIKPAPPLAAWDGSKTIESWDENTNVVNGYNADVYQQDAFFPASCVATGVPATMRKWRVAEFDFFPVLYNPVTATLTVIDRAEVVVSYSRTGSATKAFYGADGAMDDVAQQLFDNFDGARAWYGVDSVSLKGITYPYAIITTNEIKENSHNLADFETVHEAGGLQVLTVTEDRTFADLGLAGALGGWGGGYGNAAAENIRTWLADNYAALGIEYVLLIGNPHPGNGDVPMKMCYPNIGGTVPTNGDSAPTDFYYAELTGNWDLNDDGIYGEWSKDSGPGGIEALSELYVGRIPVYEMDYSTLDAILFKTIKYLMPDENTDWRHSVLLPMKPLDEVTFGYSIGEHIRMSYAAPQLWQSYRIYEEDYGCSPNLTPCTSANVEDAWQSGFGLVTWCTHGSQTGASHIFDTSQCAALNDDRPAITFQCSCYNGYPEASNNLGYSLLIHGAIATLSGSRVSWYAQGEENWNVTGTNVHMAGVYSGNIIHGETVGKASTLARQSIQSGTYKFWMNTLVFNLYGDPALSIDSALDSVGIGRDAWSFLASAAPGGTAANQTFRVWAQGNGSISYTITENPPVSWLSVTPATGTSSGEKDTVTLSFNPAGLPIGRHKTDLRISAPSAINSPVTIPVELLVRKFFGELVDEPLEWETSEEAPWFEDYTTTHDGQDAARSWDIGEGESSWCQATVTGPGILTFWWSVSSNWVDVLSFSLDGKTKTSISGIRDWQQYTQEIPEGTHLLTWKYTKSSSNSSGGDCGWLDQVEFTPITVPYVAITPSVLNVSYRPGEAPAPLRIELWNAGGGTLTYSLASSKDWVSISPVSGTSTGEVDVIELQFDAAGLAEEDIHASATLTINAPGAYHPTVTNVFYAVRTTSAVPLAEALDAPELDWYSSGYALWSGSSRETAPDGVDAACSGDAPAGRTSELCVRLEGPGYLNFWRKTDLTTGQGFYGLYVDGELQGPRLTGVGNWTQEAHYLLPGSHEVRWVVELLGYSPQRIWLDQVDYEQELPLFGTSVDAISAWCQPGQDADSQTFQIWNSGNGTLGYMITPSADWISVSPSFGEAVNEHDTITVSFDTSSLAVGQYEAELRLTSPGMGALVTIPVTLQMGTRHDAAFDAFHDTTIYNGANNASNGAGQYIIAGKYNGLIRRGLLAFNVSSIPSDAVVTDVSLDLSAQPNYSHPAAFPMKLVRAASFWGEAGSDAAHDEFDGAPAQEHDSTWLHSDYSRTLWKTAGGDLNTKYPEIPFSITRAGLCLWGSGLIELVQDWVDDPSKNMGCFILCDERDATVAKQIASREHAERSRWPRLSVTYFTTDLSDTIVPDVVGLTQSNAQAAIEAVSLELGTVTPQYSETIPKAEVISQSPAAGTLVITQSDVDLVVSAGPAPIPIPEVRGETEANAEAILTAAGFRVGAKTQQYTTYSAGRVALQTPTSKETAPRGTAIDLVISLGTGSTLTPQVVGKTQTDARAAIVKVWLDVGTVTQANSATVAAGRVISQNPSGNTLVRVGSDVNLVVSIGPATATVPDLAGMTQAEAETALASASLTLGSVAHANSTTVAAGQVMQQNPEPGSAAVQGAAVDIVVSDGPVSVSVPDVAGMTLAEAQAALYGSNLLPVETYEYSAGVPAGEVMGQNPAAGTAVPEGSAVTLTVSSGVFATVPDLTGMSQAEAESALTAVGLIVGEVTEEYNATVAYGDVIRQSPAAGAAVAPGSAVALVISRGEATDVNHDGQEDAVDVQLVINGALGLPTPNADPDVNGDEVVNAIDIQLVINGVLGII